MKVLHLISGGETGGSKKHLLDFLNYNNESDCYLVVFQDGPISEAAKSLGIKVHSLNQSSRYDVGVIFNLVKFIRKQNFDIIHTHGARANFFTLIIKFFVNVKWISTIHSDPSLDFMDKGFKGKIFSKLNILSYKFIDHLLAVSKPTVKLLNSVGVSNNKISLIYNGISFSPSNYNGLSRADLQINKTDFVIAMVARLHPVKGHKDVLEALNQLNDSSIKLLVVGDGDEHSILQGLVSKYNLEEQVKFLGFRKDIPDIYQISDIALLASYSETFPLSLLEAAKEKVPVIATHVGGVPEMLGKHGWIVNINQPTEIASAIKEAQNKPKTELDEIGRSYYLHAKQNYSIEKFTDRINAIYEKIKS